LPHATEEATLGDMRFHSLEEAEAWLVSVDGWFETRSTVSDDDQGYVMANKRTAPDEVVSRPGYFKRPHRRDASEGHPIGQD